MSAVPAQMTVLLMNLEDNCHPLRWWRYLQQVSIASAQSDAAIALLHHATFTPQLCPPAMTDCLPGEVATDELYGIHICPGVKA